MSSSVPCHWLFRVGPDASNLYNCSKHNVWGLNSSNKNSKKFVREAKHGDLLWFVKGGASKGLIVAFAVYTGSVTRVKGENLNDNELGWNYQCPWVKSQGWDIEIQYEEFKYIEQMQLLSEIQQSANPRVYNEKCKVYLPEIYAQFKKEEHHRGSEDVISELQRIREECKRVNTSLDELLDKMLKKQVYNV